ncbi:hypothetical protein BSL78_21608 [Apostichopus japonicus]|uniref:Uncharacterized protein n=1 Tax=Stichopus japonicus TaxID=307972 RepID=A0A2G8JB30_STIJA|nr:hypothetical protein BSL78_30245 [Apostichopus japonicus]PIK41528.1 hypothetical protein BSL78_21608 [Apostichopus japonicus]
MASKTNICKVAPKVINQATFFRKSSGLGLHQRSVSSPAAYAPSLSPTEEEAGGGGGKAIIGAVSVEPSEENKDKHREIDGESSTAESVDNKIIDELQDSGNHAEENCQVPTAGEEGGGEGSVSIGENETTNSVVAGDHQHLLESVVRESPTHSIVSTVSSDSFNPPTTSSSSSLSSHELTPSSQAQSCQTFRFDFRIEEEEKGQEGEKEVGTTTEKDESAKNRRNEDNKEVEKVVGMPLTEGGNSPVIEGISAKEGKKKRRNRKKKKKNVSELVGEDKEKEEGENDQENQKESINSQVELSLGGGEFKFNFDDKVAKS